MASRLARRLLVCAAVSDVPTSTASKVVIGALCDQPRIQQYKPCRQQWQTRLMPLLLQCKGQNQISWHAK